MTTKRKASSYSVKHANLTGYSEETTSFILTKMKQCCDKKIRKNTI